MGLGGFLLIDVWHNCLKTDLIVDWKIVAPAARLFFSLNYFLHYNLLCFIKENYKNKSVSFRGKISEMLFLCGFLLELCVLKIPENIIYERKNFFFQPKK